MTGPAAARRTTRVPGSPFPAAGVRGAGHALFRWESLLSTRCYAGSCPDVVSARSGLACPRRLLVPKCDRAGHEVSERRDLQDGSRPVRQRLAEQHEPGRDRDRVRHHVAVPAAVSASPRWYGPRSTLVPMA